MKKQEIKLSFSFLSPYEFGLIIFPMNKMQSEFFVLMRKMNGLFTFIINP